MGWNEGCGGVKDGMGWDGIGQIFRSFFFKNLSFSESFKFFSGFLEVIFRVFFMPFETSLGRFDGEVL